MARVHLALDLKHRRKVAVKVLDADFASELGFARFLREIEIAAGLNHPNILALHDSGEAAGALYYVTPYVEGRSVRDRLVRETRLPVDEALRITKEVADALQYAHDRGVIHRDIKPDNILIQSGHAVVADFGIARAVSAGREAEAQTLTRPGAPIGTAHYMSPEQAGGEQNLDGRSDQYALACVLYEMLSGQPPITGPSFESILVRQLTVDPPRITDLQPDVPSAVAAALARALSKAPDDRFSDMAAFAAALEAPEAPTNAPPPTQLTSFIGRERETAVLLELLDTTRLLTLTGAGGSGKTRLALEVASRARREYPDGVAWVELAALSNPELVPHHVTDALRVRRDGARSAEDALVEALGDRKVLLVLDNCEHLVDACARMAETLLKRCPELQILATSREPLGIAGERTWLVPPLTEGEGVRLLLERSQAVRPSLDFTDTNAEAMVQIVRRLDGLPLAIELAAARARILDPRQIAARLENVFALLSAEHSRTALPHHRTLRSTIEWSHELLSKEEQVLFRRLAVFAGGFTIDAVEAIASGGLDLLSALVEKSLVLLETEAVETRYRMLETIRQYAQERLEQAGDAVELARRHAHFFLTRAEEKEQFLASQTEGWQERLAEDLGNLRTAANWFEQQADPEGALRLAAALHWLWFGLGHYREARRRLETALARSEGIRTRARGRALASLATYLALLGEQNGLRAMAEESVDILQETAPGSSDHLIALIGLGQAHFVAGDLASAASVLADAVAIGRSVQPEFWITYAQYWEGRVAQARGDFALARASFDDGLARGIALGHNQPIAHLATMRGRLALAESDPDGAQRLFAIAIPALRKLKNHWSTIMLVEDLAQIAVARGDAERAARLLGASAHLREEAGARELPLEREALDRLGQSARASIGAETFDAAFRAGRTLSVLQALDLAVSMMGTKAEAPVR
jgi:non-specific serine/threonine protein kinase